MELNQNKFEEVTLYNFVSLRSPQNREKGDKEVEIDFIFCDLLKDGKSKIHKLDEISKINKAHEVSTFDEIYEYSENFKKIVDVGKILNEYRYKEIDFYKINKKLQTLDYSDEVVNDIKRITWRALTKVTKFGGDLKFKEALINILRIFHFKRHVQLISDPEYKKDIPFFKRLMDAQVVIPQELFPKEDTFFFGEKIKHYQVQPDVIERVLNSHRINSTKYQINKLILDHFTKVKKEKELIVYQTKNGFYINSSPSNDHYKTPFFCSLLISNGRGAIVLTLDDLFFKQFKIVKKAELLVLDGKNEQKHPYAVANDETPIITSELIFELNGENCNAILQKAPVELTIKGFIVLMNDSFYKIEVKVTREKLNDSDDNSIIQYYGDDIIIIDDGKDFYGQAFAPSGYGVKQLGIAEYRKVVSTISRYVPAEVAKIENVMASEYREMATVKELTKEVTAFESSEMSNERVSESISTDRFQIQNEIAQIFSNENTNKFDTKASYGAGSTKLEISYGTSTVNSKNESNKQAVTNAKEITNKAVEKIFTKVRKERTVKVTEKFTESNKHGFDNRGNINHVSGVYRHINAVYKNQINNYGRRLMYEFSIPEPALFHKLAILKDDTLAELLKTIPKHPIIENAPKDYTEVTRENYLYFEKLFELKFKILPEEIKVILQDKYFDNGGRSATSYDLFEFPETDNSFRRILLDEGFEVNSYQFKIHSCAEPAYPNGLEYDTVYPKNQGFIDFIIGGSRSRIHTYDGSTDRPIIPLINKNVDNYNLNPKILDWYISTNDIHRIAFTLTINTKMSSEYYINWQKNIFDLIEKKYEEENNKYLKEIKKVLEENPISDKFNDTDKEYIQHICLRKQCISYLISDDPQNSYRKMGQEMFENRQFLKNLKVNMSLELNEYTAFARFLEQAFDWNAMSYSYYPFYWAKESEWKLMYNLYDGDSDFRKFLQAGMARVIVGVRPGFEGAVMQYMLTGKIWEGGETPTYSSSMFFSIAAEIKENPEYKIEETWESILPTNLIALQSSGVAINQEGLPNLEKNQDLGEMTDNPHKFPKRKKFLGLF